MVVETFHDPVCIAHRQNNFSTGRWMHGWFLVTKLNSWVVPNMSSFFDVLHGFSATCQKRVDFLISINIIKLLVPPFSANVDEIQGLYKRGQPFSQLYPMILNTYTSFYFLLIFCNSHSVVGIIFMMLCTLLLLSGTFNLLLKF